MAGHASRSAPSFTPGSRVGPAVPVPVPVPARHGVGGGGTVIGEAAQQRVPTVGRLARGPALPGSAWIWLRLGLYASLLLLGAAAATLGLALAHADYKLRRQIEVPVGTISVPTDPAALARGRYLYRSRGCVDCHGGDGGGKTLINDGKGLYLRGPNIAPGGQAVAGYRVEDWMRAIRHGVKPDGRAALIMPSEDYNRLSNPDLGALIAYLQRLPRADGGPAVLQLSTQFRAMYGLGLIQDAAEKIDHRRPPSAPTPPAISVANGQYVASMCIGCHGPGYSGGKIPGAPAHWPAASNLTPGPGSVMADYPDVERFAAMMHSGMRPDGSMVSPVMPFGALRELDDTDLRSLYLFLHTLEAKPYGQR
jgi:mono/diheme cytochrome c family protein